MRSIIEQLKDRYSQFGSSHHDMILKMFDKMLTNCDLWPIDKTNRWLGFIQGILFAEGLLDVQKERDFTRPLFHDYYRSTGIEIPKSISIDE